MLFALLPPHVARAAITFTVNTTADTVIGNSCDGTCSLREAITAANANPGADIIAFNIQGTPPFVINTTGLPPVTEQVLIDGTTQPGFVGRLPLVALDGGGANVSGFVIQAAGSQVKSLAIGHFGRYGIEIQAANVLLTGNFIGLDPTGIQAAPNGTVGSLSGGVRVTAGPTGIGTANTADANVISGNIGQGIDMGSGGANSTIVNNFIGTDYTGSGANRSLGNTVNGIFVAANGTAIGSNVIRNNGAGIGFSADLLHITRNLITGNGVGIDGSGSFNFFGFNTVDGNTNDGILIGFPNASTNRNQFEDNTIRNNGGNGIVLRGP